MNRYALRIVWILGLLAASCSNMQVSVDYDPSVAWSRLRTYAWKTEVQRHAGDALVDSDTLLRQRVVSAVDTELAIRGYVKTTQRPDLLATFMFSRQLRLDNTYPYPPYGGYFGAPYFGYWGNWYSPAYGPYGPGYTREYEEGTLAIDFLDAGSDRLLWRGQVKYMLRFQESPEARSLRLQKAVSAALEGFPPGRTR